MASSNRFRHALNRNQAWAGYQAHQNPGFFKELAVGQTPPILWLGCSDSRVPETTILGLQPGDVFVHRNIANIMSPTDINTSSVIEYAVAHLKVKHVILCGHSGCGGAKAALSGTRVGGVLDTWLAPLRGVCASHAEELNALKSDDERAVRVAELNVEHGVSVLMSNMVIQEAICERGLHVHGCMFDLATGRVRDLGIGTEVGDSLDAETPSVELDMEALVGHPLLDYGGTDVDEPNISAAAKAEALHGGHSHRLSDIVRRCMCETRPLVTDLVRGSHAQLIFSGQGAIMSPQ